MQVLVLLFAVNNNKKYKKKQNKIAMLAKSKLNSVETLIYQGLIDLEISYKEFKTTFNKEENYRKLKENIRMMKSD